MSYIIKRGNIRRSGKQERMFNSKKKIQEKKKEKRRFTIEKYQQAICTISFVPNENMKYKKEKYETRNHTKQNIYLYPSFATASDKM